MTILKRMRANVLTHKQVQIIIVIVRRFNFYVIATKIKKNVFTLTGIAECKINLTEEIDVEKFTELLSKLLSMLSSQILEELNISFFVTTL